MMLFGPNPKELMKAFAIYGAAAPAGGTAGVFLGGVITEWISWPWVFYVNIPIALGVLARPRAAARAPARRGSIDLAARSPPPPASRSPSSASSARRRRAGARDARCDRRRLALLARSSHPGDAP